MTFAIFVPWDQTEYTPLCLASLAPILFGQFSSTSECQKNDHFASPHPSPDGREKLATQILGGDTIHNTPQIKKLLWPGPAGCCWEMDGAH